MEGASANDNQHNKSSLSISLVKIEESVRGNSSSQRKEAKSVMMNNAMSTYSRNSVDMSAAKH